MAKSISPYRKNLLNFKKFSKRRDIFFYGPDSSFSCISPSNIAEGSGRGSNADYVRFLNIAKGSCSELETQILLAEKFGYISQIEATELMGLCEEILKMIVSIIKKFQSNN